ncbi:MAG: FkbM family methyltransferase [Acidimicrobiales bacterium]
MPSHAVVSRRSRRLVKRWRWRAARAAGIDRYTWASLNALDRRLVELFEGATGGTFIELGANDGLQQSNTLALESLHGWSGLLIEADPELAAECRRNRPQALVMCAAAAPTWGICHLIPSDLFGSVTGGAPGGQTKTLLVPTAPLSAIIDAAGISAAIDLVSLDVEGYELEVLSGLDLNRHRPQHLLIETVQPDAVLAALGHGYVRAATWSHHDHLFSAVDEVAAAG